MLEILIVIHTLIALFFYLCDFIYISLSHVILWFWYLLSNLSKLHWYAYHISLWLYYSNSLLLWSHTSFCRRLSRHGVQCVAISALQPSLSLQGWHSCSAKCPSLALATLPSLSRYYTFMFLVSEAAFSVIYHFLVVLTESCCLPF